MHRYKYSLRSLIARRSTGLKLAAAVAIMTVVFRAFGIDVTGMTIDVSGF